MTRMVLEKKTMLFLWVLLYFDAVSSYQLCSEERGGGICPDYNTCCATGTPGISSCISGMAQDVQEGDCCSDIVTGCKGGYQCAGLVCHRIDPNYNGSKPEPLVLPRCRLSALSPSTLTQVYGFPLDDPERGTTMNVAYYSTMGSIRSSSEEDLQNQHRVSTVLIMVHGSDRNAGDFLMAGNNALPLHQQNPSNSTVMILSPWFLDPNDNNMAPHTTSKVIPVALPPNTLRWIGKPHTNGRHGRFPSHTWRYGANAVNSSISSFSAVDALVDHLVRHPVRFPSLRRIVVAGHSAGGQFVHRWALLSDDRYGNSTLGHEKRQIPVTIRVVPANPRCFVFLDPRRFLSKDGATRFQLPDDAILAKCPYYNEWLWGLDPGGRIPAPYKDRAVSGAGGPDALARRYITQRMVAYLAGGQDLQDFDDDCASRLQGETRRQRSHHFIQSLWQVFPQEMKELGGNHHHRRWVVPGVPHDHNLMFQSTPGQVALFGEEWTDAEY